MDLIKILHVCVPDMFNTWQLAMHLDWSLFWTLCITFGNCLFDKLPMSFLVSTSIVILMHPRVTFIHCMVLCRLMSSICRNISTVNSLSTLWSFPNMCSHDSEVHSLVLWKSEHGKRNSIPMDSTTTFLCFFHRLFTPVKDVEP